MILKSFNVLGVDLTLSPADCAHLARFCSIAQGECIAVEEQPIYKTAEAFEAVFRACAAGGMIEGNMTNKDIEAVARDLADLGLADLLEPMPGTRSTSASSPASE